MDQTLPVRRNSPQTTPSHPLRSNPRRRLAQDSVSLKHYMSRGSPSQGHGAAPSSKRASPGSSLVNNREDSYGSSNAEHWFERSNNMPDSRPSIIESKHVLSVELGRPSVDMSKMSLLSFLTSRRPTPHRTTRKISLAPIPCLCRSGRASRLLTRRRVHQKTFAASLMTLLSRTRC